MVFDGWMRVGGNEIFNSPRAEGITRSIDCAVPWIRGDSCDTLQDAIGDTPYSAANIATAPWYDPDAPELSSRVLGVYGMGFKSVKDSTRSVQVTEGLDDGGVIGSMRKGVRQVRARIAIVAIGDDAMEYARTWLEAALDPGACGQHAEECGTTDVEYLAACPPERGTVTYLSDWAVQQTNLLTNPSFEAGGAPVVVRTNYCRNPNFETDTATWGSAIDAAYTALSRTTTQKHSGAAALQAVTPGSWGDEGVYSTNSATTAPAGSPFSTSAWVLFPAGQSFEITAYSSGSGYVDKVVTYTGTGAWQYVKAEGGTVGASSNPYTVIRTKTAAAITFYVDDVLIEMSPTAGSYFDGGFQSAPDVDFSTRWTGTANASASELYGVGVAGLTVANAVAVRSTRWKKQGAYSVRVIATHPTNRSYVEFAGTPAPAGAVTGIATVYTEAPIPVGASRARALGLGHNAGNANINTGNKLEAGEVELRLPATMGVPGRFLLFSDTKQGDPDVWWDLATLIAGTYTGPAFTGSSTPTDPNLQRYAWTGTADASTSTYKTRQWAKRPQTDDEYAAVVDPLRRYLHEVTATGGPTLIQEFKRRRGDDLIVGQVLEFTLTAGRPWVYGVTKDVDLPSTTPSVIEDIAYNLERTPSMTVPDTIIAQSTNYSTNPSVETDATGWATSVNAPVTAGMVASARSTEIAAVGLASFKATFTASAAGAAGGWFACEQTVALGFSTVRERFSLNMWATAAILTGSPTVTGITIEAIWKNAGGSALGTTTLGTLPIAGGVLNVTKVLPPTGATQVTVRARCNLGAFASGNVVALFADALSVSMP